MSLQARITALAQAVAADVKSLVSTAAAHVAAGDPHPQYTTTAEAAAAAPVQSVAGKTGAVTLAKADVGLSSVDDTSDANKPVSTATQTALDGKVDKVAGKQLSAEDYTSAEKTKLSGIATGATANATDAQLRDRATHTGAQAINTVTGLQTALDSKQPIDADLTAIAAIAGTSGLLKKTAANTWVLDTTAYTTNTGTVTGVTGTAPIVSSGGTAPVISMAAATASVNGYMTSTYAAKLDGIAAGAQVNTVTTVAGKTGAVLLVKTDVGLGNVDNTSDASKPVSTATQSALDLKANVASPSFTGTPLAPTAGLGTNTTQVATTAYVKAEIGSVAAPIAHVGTSGAAHATATTTVAGFMSAADKTKLDGVATGATNYAHPANHPASIITQDANNRFVTDAEKTAWNSKAAGTHTHAIADTTGLQAALDAKQDADADLTAIAALAGTSGLLKKTAADTWTLDTTAYTTNTGTVTSVGVSVPTGLSVTGSPVTSSGTIAIDLASGYSIPTTTKQTNWDVAYGWGNHASAGYSTLTLGSAAGAALAASGSAGSATTAAKSDHVHPFPTAANVGAVAATGGAASGLTLNDGYTEEVFAVTGTTPALSPTNGSIQTWTLTGNATPTAGTWASGQAMTLMVDDGSAYTINWASMSITWKTGGGTAPTLLTSGYTVIELVNVGSTIYGWLAGDA